VGDEIVENKIIEDVIITPLKIIDVLNGDVLHGLKATDSCYDGFGEAYFTTINSGAIKAWKRHHKMTMNLIVPTGVVRFVLFDDRHSIKSNGYFQQVVLSRKHYFRLTIPPMIWVGFQGQDNKESTILNIANIQHQANEVDQKDKKEINFNWELS
jgi:dTDP-4-dehydrorhamnose 3,5-epimerase